MNRWNAMMYAAQKPYDFLEHHWLKHLLMFPQKHGSEYSNNLGNHLDQLDLVFDHQRSLGQDWLYMQHDKNTPYLAYPHGPLT